MLARIRTIKPEFWVDDVMVELSFEARLLFIGIWNFADDKGFIENKPKKLKMQIFPADNILLEDYLNELVDHGRLEEFTSDQGPLLRVVNWERHQRVSKPSPSRFGGIMPKNGDHSGSARDYSGSSTESSPAEGKGKGRERKGGGIPGADAGAASPPSPFCSRHQFSEGSDAPCRACGVAWHKYEEWQADQQPDDEPYTHQHRWLADGTCIGCEAVQGDE